MALPCIFPHERFHGKIKMKICTRCGVEKPLFNFCKRADSSDGHSHWCKSCKSDYNKNPTVGRTIYTARHLAKLKAQAWHRANLAAKLAHMMS